MTTLPHDVAAILEEAPRLARVRLFIQALSEAHLFSRLGTPLDVRDKHLAHALLDVIGEPDAAPAIVTSWAEAEELALASSEENQHWNAEAMSADAVIHEAAGAVSPTALGVVMDLVIDIATKTARDGLAAQVRLEAIDDHRVIDTAIADFTNTTATAVYALIAADEDGDFDDSLDEFEDDAPSERAFSHRFSLFMRGRWPIGLVGSTYNIF